MENKPFEITLEEDWYINAEEEFEKFLSNITIKQQKEILRRVGITKQKEVDSILSYGKNTRNNQR